MPLSMLSLKTSASTDSTIRVGANATYQTPWLAELTGNSRMNIGIFFAIIAVAVIWFMLKKTTLGFEIRAVGLNSHASEYAGISAKRTIILSMIISGALQQNPQVTEFSPLHVDTSLRWSPVYSIHFLLTG